MMEQALPPRFQLAGVLAAVAVFSSSVVAQEADQLANREKAAGAIQRHAVLDGKAALWVDPALWTRVLSSRDDTLIFIHREAAAHGRIIFVEEGKSAEAQARDVLDRIRGLSPEAKVIFQEPRRVNGAEVYCFQIEAPRTKLSAMVYYGYLYGNERISVQAVAIVSRRNLGAYYVDITEFLDGLEIQLEPPAE